MPSSPSASTASAIFWTSATKSSALPEKSVSDLSCTMAATLPSRAMAIAALVVLAVLEGRDLAQALLAQDLRGLVTIALGLDERLLGVHHPGAGRVAQRLDVLWR